MIVMNRCRRSLPHRRILGSRVGCVSLVYTSRQPSVGKRGTPKMTLKKKTKTIAALVEDAATILQRIVRMKAADESGYCQCVTCGRIGHWKEMDGGHYISRTYTQHKLLEENIHPQCKGCNRFAHKIHDDYSRYMRETYGAEFVDWMSDTKRQTKKYSRPEIEDLIVELKAREKELKKNL
jgi:hypothetical protein